MIKSTRDLIADLLGEIRQNSPPIRHVPTGVNTGFSPHSPLSPPLPTETHVQRPVMRFRLIENQGGGTVIGASADTLQDLRDALRWRYGARVESTEP